MVSGVRSEDFGMPSDIAGETLAEGTKRLKEFIEFAESSTPPWHVTAPKRATDSVFEDQVLAFVDDVLKNSDKGFNYEAHTQVGCKGYWIDIAIFDTKTQKYVLGIECDGAAFHSSRHARARDRIRHDQIVGMGWCLYHIWGGSWFRSRSIAEKTLRDEIFKACQ